jgi:8-oxo-dGTP pyrophosphatase MutT (NUDIX family)
VVGRPDLVGVVPGGGIEPGESVEQAVAREVSEEAGIFVQCVRELGVVEQRGQQDPTLVHESHFVHAASLAPTEQEWTVDVPEHGRVRCRWMPIAAGMAVWGVNRGALLDSILRKRVVGYVTRGRQLLVFDHEGTTQVPAGRIDAHEDLHTALAREVEEETGIAGVLVVRELAGAAEFARLYGPGAHESHAFHAVTDADTPHEWDHRVTGTGMDSGLVFRCRWAALEDRPLLWGKPDPLVERLLASISTT